MSPLHTLTDGCCTKNIGFHREMPPIKSLMMCIRSFQVPFGNYHEYGRRWKINGPRWICWRKKLSSVKQFLVKEWSSFQAVCILSLWSWLFWLLRCSMVWRRQSPLLQYNHHHLTNLNGNMLPTRLPCPVRVNVWRYRTAHSFPCCRPIIR